VTLAQLAFLVGVIGGAAVLALFPAGTVLFGAYGIGLLAGFLGYFGMLVVFVRLARRVSSGTSGFTRQLPSPAWCAACR